MVQIELKWPDGSRIFYKKDSGGYVRRCIQYADGRYVDNTGKYYYLKVLENFRDIGQRTYQDLEYICNITSYKYDKMVETELCQKFRNCIYGEGDGTCIFMTTIYLAMVDLEEGKINPNWPGKRLVLDSCKAVLLDGISFEKAAVMYL